jgi:hypothetical protein
MQIKRDFAGSTDMWPTSAGGQVIEVANLTGFTVLINKQVFRPTSFMKLLRVYKYLMMLQQTEHTVGTKVRE